MEIKVQCRKDDKGAWVITKPGKVFVRERRVVWTFEGLEPGIVPLLAFKDNHPHGPFLDAWLTGPTFTAELGELPGTPAAHEYEIVLIQWKPEPAVAATVSHELIIGARPVRPVEVFWRRGMDTIDVKPEVRDAGGASLVEWRFDIPENVYATIEFASSAHPTGPFAELHGRKCDGVYRVTGQTDLVKDIYKYTVGLYDRTNDALIIRDDPKIDNNGDPIG
jgi:hypothetical protein